MTTYAHLREDYSLSGLHESDVDPDPMVQFERWFQDARNTGMRDANAMTLATADRRGRPSARVVLLKGADKDGFVFFTSYESQKGRELEENPQAALVFYWGPMERQVRINGTVSRVTREEVVAYFHSRPRGSQISASISHQSQVVRSRDYLEAMKEARTAELEGQPVPVPDAWGGYRVQPDSIEFWQGRPNRLHDRLLYTRNADGIWSISRLSP